MRNPSRACIQRGLVMLAMVVSLAMTGGVRGEDTKSALRKRALQLNTITGADTIQGTIQDLVADKERTRAMLKVAAEMAKEKPNPFNLNATLILASTAQELKEVDISETFYLLNTKQAIKLLSGRGLSRAYLGRIQLLYDAGKYAEAETACREFLGIEGDKSIDGLKGPVLRQLILCLYKQKKTDKALELLDKVLKAQPKNYFNLDLKGRLLRAQGKVKEATQLYENMIERMKKEERLSKEEREEFLDDYRYALSGLYIDQKQVDKAAEQLKTLLRRHPDNPTYNNDLGYIWADHDMNLEESEKLIRRAIEEDRKRKRKRNPALKPDEIKDTAAYLDSLGWVLFKQKKYKEALVHLRKAVEDPAGKHIEIYDHLAEVYKALGKKEEAIAAWKKGLEVAGDNAREQQRKAKVEKKLKEMEK